MYCQLNQLVKNRSRYLLMNVNVLLIDMQKIFGIVFFAAILLACGGDENAAPAVVIEDPNTQPEEDVGPVKNPNDNNIDDPLSGNPPEIDFRFDTLGAQIDSAMLGSWTTVFDNVEQQVTFNSDGSCEYRTIIYGAGESTLQCRWGVLSRGSTNSLIVEDSDKSWLSYELEKPDQEDRELIRQLVEKHVLRTGSPKGERVLKSWNATVEQFVKVMPVDYKRVLEEQRRATRIPEPSTDGQEETEASATVK